MERLHEEDDLNRIGGNNIGLTDEETAAQPGLGSQQEEATEIACADESNGHHTEEDVGAYDVLPPALPRMPESEHEFPVGTSASTAAVSESMTAASSTEAEQEPVCEGEDATAAGTKTELEDSSDRWTPATDGNVAVPSYKGKKGQPRRSYKLTSWDERFRQLKEFHAENGHFRVPRREDGLGTWVSVHSSTVVTLHVTYRRFAVLFCLCSSTVKLCSLGVLPPDHLLLVHILLVQVNMQVRMFLERVGDFLIEKGVLPLV